MTRDEFETVVIPFLHLYWEKHNYYDLLDGMWGKPIRIGNMILFCTTSYIPDDIIIVDDNDNIVDGYHVTRDNSWNNISIEEQLTKLGIYSSL